MNKHRDTHLYKNDFLKKIKIDINPYLYHFFSKIKKIIETFQILNDEAKTSDSPLNQSDRSQIIDVLTTYHLHSSFLALF